MKGEPMIPAKRKAAVWGATLAVLAGWAAGAQAEETPPVQVRVLGIRATNEQTPHVDAELEPLKASLARFGYNSFRVAAKARRPVPAGQTTEVALIEDYALRITVGGADEENVTLTLTWVRYEKDAEGRRAARVLQRVPMTLRKGKFFVCGGWQLKEGALVAAVSAE